MSQTYLQDQPPQAAKIAPSDPDQMWYGHLPCVGNSRTGCGWHKGRNHFYNPFLPPYPRMKLVKNEGRWHISEQIDTSATKCETPSPLAFFGALPPKLCKLLTPKFLSARNNKASKDETSHGVQKPCSDEHQAPEEHSDPPPQYSAIGKLISNVPYYPGHVPRETQLSAEDSCPYVWGSNLPFDPASFKTIKPMHLNMVYDLAFYHLHTARRIIESLGLENDIFAVPDLCCAGYGSLVDHYPGDNRSQINGPTYIWRNDIYYAGQFLQRQEVTYPLGMHSPDPKGIDITMCRHFTSSLSDVRLWMEDGWLRASTSISHKSHLSISQKRSLLRRPDPYNEGQPCNAFGDKIHWKSAKGKLADITNCEFCHCSLERSLEVRGKTLDVRFTIYRVLGAGLDRFDPKWNSLLTGSGTMRPPRKGDETHDVYRQVMRVAHSLGIEGLHWPTFRTPHGDFTALPVKSEADDVALNKIKPLTMNWQSLCQ